MIDDKEYKMWYGTSNMYDQNTRAIKYLCLAVSKDGKTWKQIYVLENTKGEFSYPAIIQDKEGYIHITYTYKREKVEYLKIKLED